MEHLGIIYLHIYYMAPTGFQQIIPPKTGISCAPIITNTQMGLVYLRFKNTFIDFWTKHIPKFNKFESNLPW